MSAEPENPIDESYLLRSRISDLEKSVRFNQDLIKSIKQSEKQLRTAFDSAPIAILLSDQNNQILSWNSSLLHLTGYKAEELRMLGLHKLYSKKEWEYVSSNLFSESEGKRLETKIYSKNGEVVDVRVTFRAVFDEDGQRSGTVTIFEDLRDKKRREADKRLSEEKFKSVFESSAVAITVGDVDERIISWNLAAEKMLKMNKAQLKNKKISELYPPDEWQRIHGLDIKSKHKQQHLESKMTAADGSIIDVEISISVLKDPEGNVTGSIGIIRDISERKQAERALMISESRFRTVFENSAVGLFVVSHDNRMVSWNKEVERLLEVPADKLYLLELSKLFSKNDWKIIDTVHRKQKKSNYFETKLYRLDGSTVDVEVAFSCLNDEGDGHPGYMGILRDVSEKKRIEAEQKARRAAETSSKAKSDFLASMSHEIRTPMNGVLGMLELLMDMELTGEQYEYIKAAKNSASSLLKLLNNVLDFSKIEAGKLSLEKVNFSLRDLIGDTVSTMAARAQAKGIELNCNIRPEVPNALTGDCDRLRQVIINLVGNAIKFTEAGEILIQIELEKYKGQNARIRFCVADTGIGVSKDKQALIFGNFEQADQSTSRRYGGTGLGLSISTSLVELMGGKISLSSPSEMLSHDEGGVGSCFEFALEFEVEEHEQQQSALVHDVHLEGLKILIVDDNAVQRKILKEMCESWQMIPTVSANASQALALIDQINFTKDIFDFLLIDAHMPEMNGFTLIERIRKRRACDTSKIIMMVEAGNVHDVTRCRQNGVEIHIRKPVYQSRLFDAIVNYIGAPAQKRKQTFHKRNAQEKKSLKVLVVEDNPVNQLVATKLLERDGHHPVVAADGKEVFKKLAEETFDLIFMDIQLPDMDGYEITSAIREMERMAGIRRPIIAMTANAMPGDREKCLAHDMDDYVAKPIRPQILYSVLDKWILEIQKYEKRASDSLLKKNRPSDSIAAKVSQIKVEEDDKSIIDLERGLSHTDNDEEIFRSMLQVYVEDAPLILDNLFEAIKNKDRKVVENALHKLKGSSKNIGAVHVGKMAAELEKQAYEIDFKTQIDAFTLLEEKTKDVVNYIGTKWGYKS